MHTCARVCTYMFGRGCTCVGVGGRACTCVGVGVRSCTCVHARARRSVISVDVRGCGWELDMKGVSAQEICVAVQEWKRGGGGAAWAYLGGRFRVEEEILDISVAV